MNSLPNKKEMQRLIVSEIESMELKLRTFANSILVDIQETKLIWEYGNNEKYPAWTIGDLRERDVIVMYCPNGHGAYGNPWGINFSTSHHFGQGNCWYNFLEELLLDGWLD